MAFCFLMFKKFYANGGKPWALTNENFTFNPLILIFYCKFFC